MQLLHKLSIRGVNGPEKLLKVIKVRLRITEIPTLFDPTSSQNPITDHLPVNTYKLSMSTRLTKIV